MAEPPDPTVPGGPTGKSGDGWIRPSDRAGAPPPTEPVTAPGPAAAGDAGVATTPTRHRRRARNRNRRRVALSAGALALVLAVVAALVLTSGGGSSPAAKLHLAQTPLTTAPTAAPPPALIATTKVASLQVFDQAAATGKVVTTLSAKTDYGLPRTLLATSVQGGWLQVLLPTRPNGGQGWVRATDVTTSSTDYQLHIVLSTHHLTLVKAGVPVVGTTVVIGKKETPTPTGLFYVTDPVDLQTQPNGAYGAFALGLSGFSDVLTSFNGGPGQIAVHGTPNTDQVGQDLSNGCVRIPNPLIVQIAKTVPLGTPVMVTA